MDEAELAKRLLKYQGKHNGVILSTGNARQMGNVAKEVGIPLNELLNFIRPLLHEIVDELYTPKKIKEDWSGS
ncbi:MAG: hypothetical protein PHO90_02070 [Candidatus Pacebacteria bacterium]|nr:hypothetical protein [Candidatus Paceibacterota bacterium]